MLSCKSKDAVYACAIREARFCDTCCVNGDRTLTFRRTSRRKIDHCSMTSLWISYSCDSLWISYICDSLCRGGRGYAAYSGEFIILCIEYNSTQCSNAETANIRIKRTKKGKEKTCACKKYSRQNKCKTNSSCSCLLSVWMLEAYSFNLLIFFYLARTSSPQ